MKGYQILIVCWSIQTSLHEHDTCVRVSRHVWSSKTLMLGAICPCNCVHNHLTVYIKSSKKLGSSKYNTINLDFYLRQYCVKIFIISPFSKMAIELRGCCSFYLKSCQSVYKVSSSNLASNESKHQKLQAYIQIKKDQMYTLNWISS